MSINKTSPAIAEQRNQPRPVSFKKFSLSNKPNGSAARNETCRVRAAIKRKLREITDTDDDHASSIFAAISVGSSNREAALELLESEIRNMSEKMDIAVTVVPIQ
jgi:hypothetical protein